MIKKLQLIQIHGIDIEANFINKHNISVIWNYLKTRDVNTAKIFYLYFVQEMTLKEISQELKQNESTIKSNLYRMLKKLKKDFGGGKFE